MIITNAADYKRDFKTVFVGDYKDAFAKEVDQLISLHLEDVEQRMEAVQFLIDAYITDTDERPDGVQLDLLASHLLYESLEGDTRPDKMTLEDYPIMTQPQFDRREKERGEFYVNFEGEGTGSGHSFNITNTLGSDGKSYAKPHRRHRRTYENDVVNQKAQLRNKERNAQYKKDTSPSSITRYNAKEVPLTPSFQNADGVIDRYREVIAR